MAPAGNRTYGHYCGLARALDVVGDRWSLLIVRELLTGPLRFSELERGLPGVAKNLLSERLRDLERTGVVTRGAVSGDARGVSYELSEWGAQLRPAVRELAWWGGPLMEEVGDVHMRGRWYVVGLDAVLAHRAAPERAITYEVTLDMQGEGDETGRVFVEGVQGVGWRVTAGGACQADFVVVGTPPALLGVHAGMHGTKAVRLLDVRDRNALRAWKQAMRRPAQRYR
jgi:DNA-binding HxlR family transcriptional regulator